MDKQQLLGYFQDHYLSRQDVLFKLPLNISIDSFWQDLVNQRKARATMLPLYSATGQPYWFVTTDKMVKASERLCEEAMKHDSFFDPYRIPLSQSLTSALSQEAYFTSFVEGADYPIQAAVDFLRRGSEPENAYEQNIMNNYQAGSYLLSALSIPFDEGFVKELAATLTDGQDGYRTTDTPSIPAMEGEPYMVPQAHMLADRMGQFYTFLADVRVHPLIKAAVGQAYILATRPFQEANERLGRLISNAILLRYGYDFFLDISISAYIARESYRYFKAMREIIRSDNDGDLTYFVEYYLELLVRALDGTRMEEAERLQSQLESERKMALQPLKPTVQYTQPHSYNAEAVARVIDNAESGQEAEDGGYAPQVEHSVENHRAANDAIDGTAPDPPELPDGDASYRSSQSQAGSTQGDKQGARSGQAQMNAEMRQADKAPQEVLTPIPPGDAGPQSVDGRTVHVNSKTNPHLLGQTMKRFEWIGCMLEEGKSSFTSLDWSERFGLSSKESAAECMAMYIDGLLNRELQVTTYHYTFRFSKKEYSVAKQILSIGNCAETGTKEAFEAALSILERTGYVLIRNALIVIRNLISQGVTEFLGRDLVKGSGVGKHELKRLTQILNERGIIQIPEPPKLKYRIRVPGIEEMDQSCTGGLEREPATIVADGELLQADVAHQDMGLQSKTVMEKLAEMKESENAIHRRIACTLTDFLNKGQRLFTSGNWIEITGVSRTQVRYDMQVAMSLGLISSDQSVKSGRNVIFRIETELINSIRWDEIGLSHYQVLNSIVRLYGTKSFSRADIANATGVEPDNIGYNLKILRRFAVIKVDRLGLNDFRYQLSVPISEAITKV